MSSVRRTVELGIIELVLAVVVWGDVNHAIATDILVNVTRLQEYARWVVCLTVQVCPFVVLYFVRTAGLPAIT